MVHDLLKLTSIGAMAKPFMEIVHEYSHVIANDPALQGTMKWRMKEIMNQDPMIRVCIDHMIMTAGGISKWGEDPGYLVIENMVFKKEEEPCVGRRTRVKDDMKFDKVETEQDLRPGDDLYVDCPYEGGQVEGHITNERAFLYLNCDIDDLEAREAEGP